MKPNVQDIHRQIDHYIISIFRTAKEGVDYKVRGDFVCFFADVFGYVTKCDHITENDHLNSERTRGTDQWKVYSVTIFVSDTSENAHIEASDAMIEVDCIHLYTMYPIGNATHFICFFAVLYKYVLYIFMTNYPCSEIMSPVLMQSYHYTTAIDVNCNDISRSKRTYR